MFENSLKSIASNFVSKLDTLATQAKTVAENTEFLKSMKKIYDEQNKKLQLMDNTINELFARMDEAGDKKKKKKGR